ncbi:MAG: hypothetical protein RBT73_09655, partial [Spirochaetia bacterium]|nr:hypothetical protein [Spirochaetia bacterium]
MDKIWLLAAAKAVSPVLSGVFVLAPLAALVSTMDSQLLSLASIVAKETRLPPSRIAHLIYLIAASGAFMALFPPTDILAFLNATSFLGYAALFPSFAGVFYSKKARGSGALASMIAGEAAVILIGFKVVSTGRIPAIFVVAGVAIIAWGIGNRLPLLPKPAAQGFSSRRFADILPLRWVLIFIALLSSTILMGILEKGRRMIGAYPLWLLWSAGAGLLLSICFA